MADSIAFRYAVFSRSIFAHSFPSRWQRSVRVSLASVLSSKAASVSGVSEDAEQVASGDGGNLVAWLGMVLSMVGIDLAAPELGVLAVELLLLVAALVTVAAVRPLPV